MKSYRWAALLGATLVLVTAFSSVGFAQSDQGRFSVIIRDTQNAFIPGATLTVTNERTGESRTAVSNPQGLAFVTGLKPSTYTVRVELAGFAPVEYTNMQLAVGQELALDFELKPAGVQEAVTVVGTTPVLDTSSAKVGANVSEREVQGLPVNGRQMSQLMLQAPGSQNGGDGTWQDVSFSGRATNQNVVKYDGVEGSAIIDASPGNVNGENRTPFRLQASLENVQEFRVESSNYPAEHGTGTGGQVSVITKSGGNSFHGAVFEYLRDDALDAKNHFDSFRAVDDSVISEGPKSKLSQNQFGGSFGGPIAKDRAFFFGSYEAYRMDAGQNLIEAVPSDLAWSRAVPAIQTIRPAFTAGGAAVLPGASNDPLIDIVQLQDDQKVREHAFSGRFDLKMSQNWSFYTRVFHDQGTNDQPDGVTGRRKHFTDDPTNAVINLQGLLGSGMINDFKFGYNAAPSTYAGVAPIAAFSNSLVSFCGTVANSGIAGQGGTSSCATAGGLVRVNSQGNGVNAPYDPYSLTFADSLTRIQGNHFFKFGADLRVIRMSTDQLGGITYTYSNINSFINNTPTSVQYIGDLSAPSPFNNGATGDRHINQEYYVAYAQDEWRVKPSLTLNYGLRYDYYVPLTEADNRISKFNIDSGTLDPNTTPFYRSKKNSFQPRIGATVSPSAKTVIRSGFGVFVGPGQTEDQIQPIEADRIVGTVSSGALNTYPFDSATFASNFTTNPNNRSYQPRAYSNEYTLPEKIYQYTASISQELPGRFAASAAYVGSQGRNLFLRTISNQTIGVELLNGTTPTQIREFDILTRNASGTLTGIQRPYAEIDYKTSGGHDSYNSMQLALTRRSANGLVLNGQYTLGYSKGNSGGSNEVDTAGDNARLNNEGLVEAFSYDDGYNKRDVRHTFSFSALYTIPGNGLLTGGWSIGGIANARSGYPVFVVMNRPDLVYLDAAGNVFTNFVAGRTPVVNVPGGGASRTARERPDLIPGVDPFVQDGGRLFLNPAAFTTPKPGTFGNLERNSIHGPLFSQIDMVVSKKFGTGRGSNFEFRLEVFNLFNRTNFANPSGTLPNALPGANESPTQASRTQPGQAFTADNVGAFGQVTSTVATTTGLGTNRQVQLGFRVNF